MSEALPVIDLLGLRIARHCDGSAIYLAWAASSPYVPAMLHPVVVALDWVTASCE
jgi:hypothetical protein